VDPIAKGLPRRRSNRKRTLITLPGPRIDQHQAGNITIASKQLQTPRRSAWKRMFLWLPTLTPAPIINTTAAPPKAVMHRVSTTRDSIYSGGPLCHLRAYRRHLHAVGARKWSEPGRQHSNVAEDTLTDLASVYFDLLEAKRIWRAS